MDAESKKKGEKKERKVKEKAKRERSLEKTQADILDVFTVGFWPKHVTMMSLKPHNCHEDTAVHMDSLENM